MNAAVEVLEASPPESWAVILAADDGEGDLGAGLGAEVAAPQRLWRGRPGCLPLADGGAPTGLDAARALAASPPKSWALVLAADDREANPGAGLSAELSRPPRAWWWRAGDLSMADGAIGGGPTSLDAAVEAFGASLQKSWAVMLAADDG